MNRRQFLTLGAVTLGGIGLGYKSTVQPGSVVLEETVIQIPTLPVSFENYRIGFLSDIHLGVTLSDEVVEEASLLLHNKKIDLLLLGGDYIWIQRSALGNSMARIFNRNFVGLTEKELIPAVFSRVADLLTLKPPKDGILAIYGNHDRWEEPTLCRRAFENRGAQFLINSSVEIKRGEHTLRIIGVDDYWTGVPQIPTLPPRNKAETRVLLAHNPDYVSFLLNRKRDDFDLALCGHTHGGQIKLPLIGPPVFNIRDPRLEAGLFDNGAQKVYTTRGIGTVELPFRVNCPPEATIVELRSA